MILLNKDLLVDDLLPLMVENSKVFFTFSEFLPSVSDILFTNSLFSAGLFFLLLISFAIPEDKFIWDSIILL